MKRLQNCCFLISLKTGGKIIGWLDIIIAIIVSLLILSGFALTEKSEGLVFVLKLLFVAFIFVATAAFFSWNLIDGITKPDSHKVSIFKWYTIISFINILTSLINSNLLGFTRDYWTVYKILIESIRVLWFSYKIYVAYSIEVMLKEEVLSTVNHQMQPFIDAPKNAEDVVPPTYNDVMSDNTAKSTDD